MTTHDPDLDVTEWGTPPKPAPKSRANIYTHRLEVVRARNKMEPEVWGIIARFESKNSAYSRGSLERKRTKDFEFVVAQEGDGDWLVWARVKPRGT